MYLCECLLYVSRKLCFIVFTLTNYIMQKRYQFHNPISSHIVLCSCYMHKSLAHSIGRLDDQLQIDLVKELMPLRHKRWDMIAGMSGSKQDVTRAPEITEIYHLECHETKHNSTLNGLPLFENFQTIPSKCLTS
jgi:hypothetical protein